MSEVDSTIQRYNKRPTEVAHEAGILGPDCVAAHCVHLSDVEIDLLASTGTHVSHNPASNAKLGNGIARLPEMIQAGINVGLGHDAAECSNFIDMFTVMKFTSLIHRAARQSTEHGKPMDIIRMATVNGQKALGHGHELGSIVEGYKADCILIELRSTEFTPLVEGDLSHLSSHLVFSASGSCVDTSIIDGQVVMRNRKMLTVDEEKVVREANNAFARIKDKMKACSSKKEAKTTLPV
jgi:5-methylthioadenosine/S-adenosylhomocysteine deaminase